MCYNVNGDFMKKIFLFLCMGLIFIDQIIKLAVINNMNLYESIQVIPNFLKITFVENTGGAFGILSGGRWFFVGISFIALYALIRTVFYDSNISKFDVGCYSLMVSGIIGNLIDRIFYGKVIDYIDFNLFSFDAPVFNFADICIVVGAIMLIIILYLKGDSNENIYSRK